MTDEVTSLPIELTTREEESTPHDENACPSCHAPLESDGDCHACGWEGDRGVEDDE